MVGHCIDHSLPENSLVVIVLIVGIINCMAQVAARGNSEVQLKWMLAGASKPIAGGYAEPLKKIKSVQGRVEVGHQLLYTKEKYIHTHTRKPTYSFFIAA